MNVQQIRFVEEYCIIKKGAPAAIRAGYSKDRAKQTAYDLLKDPEIRKAIDERLKVLTISADEATKNISDMAQTRIQDFMKVKKVLRREMERKPLQLIINEQEGQIDFEKEFTKEAGLSKTDAKKQAAKIKELEQGLIRLKIELRRNPKAYRDVQGEAKWVEEAKLDLVALARAEDTGNIQELSYTEFGPKVKLYSAFDANETILKLNGKLINRHDHTNNGKSFGDYLMDT